MDSEIEAEPTYIELVCEGKLNPTEKSERIENILGSFLDGEIISDDRFDGKYLLIRNSGWEALNRLSDWIRKTRLLDTVRRRLLKSSVGNITAIYFNKQAAAMGRLSLVDVDDNPPLGAISYQIISDNIEFVVNKFTPRTHEGREISEEEWELVKYRKQKQIDKKKRS